MAISTVKVTLNGQAYNATYSGGQWQVTVTAPGATSFNLEGGYYPVSVTAVNDAGTSTTAGPSDATVGSALKLVVKERIAPVISITSPSSGAYVANNQQPIIMQLTDEAGGSGIDLSSLSIKLDGTAITGYTATAITNGYSVTATPPVMADGSHTVVVSVSDNDGNAAVEKSVTFTVDTVPPTLNISSPSDGLVTNNQLLTVQGVTNDLTSSPVTIKIALNGTDQGSVTVGSDGSFSKTVTLAEGANTIAVTATDAAGKTTALTRTVTLDTSAPTITAASVTPNPADAGATVIIKVTVI